MTIFASNLDALAQQQNFYDQLYAGANRDNANAATQAQQAQINLQLGQQEAQRRQQQIDQDEQFQAWQNSLQRQSAHDDVQMQYAGARADLGIKQNEQDFNNAVKDAMGGALPADADKLKSLYPHFNPPQINQLYQIAGSASVERLRQTAANADRAGQPPSPDMVAASGVPAGTDFEKQAHSIVSSLRAPYESDYAASQKIAQTGNVAQTDQDLRTPTPPPAGPSALNWLNSAYIPLRAWGAMFPAVPQDSVVQPTDEAVQRTALMAKAAASAAALKNPVISGQPGMYETALPPSWRPQASAQPPPGAPAQPKVVTDGRGQRWQYLGSLPDPTQDKNPANWKKIS